MCFFCLTIRWGSNSFIAVSVMSKRALSIVFLVLHQLNSKTLTFATLFWRWNFVSLYFLFDDFYNSGKKYTLQEFKNYLKFYNFIIKIKCNLLFFYFFVCFLICCKYLFWFSKLNSILFIIILFFHNDSEHHFHFNFIKILKEIALCGTKWNTGQIKPNIFMVAFPVSPMSFNFNV